MVLFSARPCSYKKAADWGLIESLAAERTFPLIGNGDILTHYEAADRAAGGGCHALMIGRGALIKPWIFQEAKEVWHEAGASALRAWRACTRTGTGLGRECCGLEGVWYGYVMWVLASIGRSRGQGLLWAWDLGDACMTMVMVHLVSVCQRGCCECVDVDECAPGQAGLACRT